MTQLDPKYIISLHFATNRNEILTINVPHANPTVPANEVAAAMQAIMDSNVLYSVRGVPIGRTGAELTRTVRREFDLVG